MLSNFVGKETLSADNEISYLEALMKNKHLSVAIQQKKIQNTAD